MGGDKDAHSFDRYVQQVIDNSLKDLHTCLPGTIVSFDPVTQIAEIQPLIKREFADDSVRNLPLCISCPVMFPRAGGFSITFPVTAGDECLVVFAERALDTWMQSGGSQPPVDTRRHSLSDAVAILGLYSQPNKLPSFHSTGIELKSDAGDIYFRLDNSGITIKGNVDIEGNLGIDGDSTTTGDHVSNGISGNSHVHGGVQSGGSNTSGPS